jgi:DNA-directed RNA polymerase specialized sigma24 family protein
LDANIQNQLKAQDWGAISEELFAFARYRAANYYLRKGSLPKGNEPWDIVQMVIEKTIVGERVWDPSKGPLLPWLKDQVKSEIDNLFSSLEQRKTIPLSPCGEDETEDTKDAFLFHHAIGTDEMPFARIPEEALVLIDEKESIETLISGLFNVLKDEPQLEKVLSIIMEGCEPKPHFIADRLGVPVEEVNNRLKRLRRLAQSILKSCNLK